MRSQFFYANHSRPYASGMFECKGQVAEIFTNKATEHGLNLPTIGGPKVISQSVQSVSIVNHALKITSNEWNCKTDFCVHEYV
jgi:hypothetical protein